MVPRNNFVAPPGISLTTPDLQEYDLYRLLSSIPDGETFPPRRVLQSGRRPVRGTPIPCMKRYGHVFGAAPLNITPASLLHKEARGYLYGQVECKTEVETKLTLSCSNDKLTGSRDTQPNLDTGAVSVMKPGELIDVFGHQTKTELALATSPNGFGNAEISGFSKGTIPITLPGEFVDDFWAELGDSSNNNPGRAVESGPECVDGFRAELAENSYNATDRLIHDEPTFDLNQDDTYKIAICTATILSPMRDWSVDMLDYAKLPVPEISPGLELAINERQPLSELQGSPPAVNEQIQEPTVERPFLGGHNKTAYYYARQHHTRPLAKTCNCKGMMKTAYHYLNHTDRYLSREGHGTEVVCN